MYVPPSGLGRPSVSPIDKPEKMSLEQKKKFFENANEQQKKIHIVGMKKIIPDAVEEPTVAVSTSKEKIEKLSQTHEAEQTKRMFSWNPMVLLIRFFSWLLSLNLFHSSQPKSKVSALQQKSEVAPVNPEALRVAAKTLMDYFETHANFKQEGVFRISGSKNRVDALVDGVIQSPVFDIANFNPSTDELAGGLKELFGKMNLFEQAGLGKQFIQLGEAILQKKQGDLVNQLKQLIGQLPIEQQANLKRMMGLLVEVKKHSAVNKMPTKNLAIVFAPRLYTPQVKDPGAAFAALGPGQAITEHLIDHYDEIFS